MLGMKVETTRDSTGEKAVAPHIQQFLDVVLNLSKYHREHEKFYAQVPLRKALDLQHASRVLKTLADRWQAVLPTPPHVANPLLGCEDLNEPVAIQESGVLFLEGEGEPPELARLKRDLRTMAQDFGETGRWLAQAMRSSWEATRPLLQVPALASVLGERHRIMMNDWQAADASALIATILTRTLEILDHVDFTPKAVRADLTSDRVFPAYLYSAAEMIDRAADLASASASLTHDNDRRWRVFHDRVHELSGSIGERPGPSAAAPHTPE